MKRRICNGIKIIILLIVLGGIFIWVNGILVGKSGMYRIVSFYEETEDSLDAVFIGSSHLYYSIYPFQLWEDYGIKSSVIGGDGVGIPLEYYCVKEAIREQHPDVIVVDLYKAFSDQKLENISYMHNLVNAWPLSRNKIQMISDLVPEENQIEFYMPLYLYHTRWKEITESDFDRQTCYTKGAAPQFGIYDASNFSELDKKEKQEVPRTALTYIQKIIDVCAENKVELIFTVIPYETTAEEMDQQRIFNQLEDELKSENVLYYNGFHMIDELGINVKEDFFDSGHLNYNGGVKLSAYIGKILSEKGIGNNSEKNDTWKVQDQLWHAYIDSKQINKIEDINEYIDFIRKKKYEYVILSSDGIELFDGLQKVGIDEKTQFPEGECVLIYNDGNRDIYALNTQQISVDFNGIWIESKKGEKVAITIGKNNYDFTESTIVIVYDPVLGNIIDVVGISDQEEKIDRKM